jgi:hypothetical protein
MSFCLAVGSPALITYSLTLAILNRRWIRQRCDRIARDSPPAHAERIKAVQYLLTEAQEVPLEISTPNITELHTTILAPESRGWWHAANDKLRDTRRGVTPSLVAQVVSAAIAYFFTVVLTFKWEFRDPDYALQASAGTVWLWMVCTTNLWPQ